MLEVYGADDYEVVIYWSSEDGCYIAEGIRACGVYGRW